MRKLIVSMNITLDGYLCGIDDELDWHFNCWTEEIRDALCGQLAKADTILLGRVTYNAMAQYWPLKRADLCCRGEDFAFANMMNNYTKMVFSKTIERTLWSNTKIVNGSLRKEIIKIKKRQGRDIIVYGSCQLVNGLMKDELIDEYHLWIHPVILGKGKSLFKDLKEGLCMNMRHATTFPSGVVLMEYQPCYTSL
ncbi:MAG: dihydrofolate reductase family protein [Agriterribacter sp.]